MLAHSKLNFYYFGDTGVYDNFSPAYVFDKEYASAIVYLIAKNKPFTISKQEIINLLGIREEDFVGLINNLISLDALEEKADTYRVKFTVFLKEDIIELEQYLNDVGERLGDKLIEMKDILSDKVSELNCAKDHSVERILYHTICDTIFDGTAFDFFSSRGILSCSKAQPGNRDYLIIAYEDSPVIEKYSNKILCSSNNYRSAGYTFNSFGDLNGTRKDMYRFFNLVEKSMNKVSPFEKLNEAYGKMLYPVHKEIALECGLLVSKIMEQNVRYRALSEKEKEVAAFLEEMEVLKISDDKVSVLVPVFYEAEFQTIVEELSDMVLNSILPLVQEISEDFEKSAKDVTPMIHGVEIKEIANELWHLMFGAVNEYLVQAGFVATPENIEGQGRFLRSIVVPNTSGLNSGV